MPPFVQKLREFIDKLNQIDVGRGRPSSKISMWRIFQISLSDLRGQADP